MPKEIKLSENFGRILGLYAAEGHCTENKVVYTFGKHEENTLVKELSLLIQEEMEIQPRLQFRPNNSINVVIYGKHWRILFESLIPGTSKHGTKRLSEHITNGPKDFLNGLLFGWFDGDGHKRRSEQSGKTVCHQMAVDFHAIATQLDLVPTLRVSSPSHTRHAKTRQPFYEVIIPLRNGHNQPKQDEKAVYRKVNKIEK
jgi:intein/homing endonuclease